MNTSITDCIDEQNRQVHQCHTKTFKDNLEWFKEKAWRYNDTIIGTHQKAICDKCGEEFEYISRGTPRHRCDDCKSSLKKRIWE